MTSVIGAVPDYVMEFNEGFGGMMPTPAERHSIHRAVDSVLLESSAHNRFAISAEGFDG